MNRELDIECAIALGWKRLSVNGNLWREPGNRVLWWTGADDYRPRTPHQRWSPSLNHDEVRLLENEIERRGLKAKYITSLLRICRVGEQATDTLWYVDINDWWTIICATPEQRCRAALEAVRGQQ